MSCGATLAKNFNDHCRQGDRKPDLSTRAKLDAFAAAAFALTVNDSFSDNLFQALRASSELVRPPTQRHKQLRDKVLQAVLQNLKKVRGALVSRKYRDIAAKLEFMYNASRVVPTGDILHTIVTA